MARPLSELSIYSTLSEQRLTKTVKTLDELSNKMDQILGGPLSNEQLLQLAERLGSSDLWYKPGRRYNEELEYEECRLHKFTIYNSQPETRRYLNGRGKIRKPISDNARAGRERTNIIARSNIKRRWQKLGVWNPEWGIPGRVSNPQASDNSDAWKWSWEDQDGAMPEWRDGQNAILSNLDHPIIRMLAQRQGLHRGEQPPLQPPQTCLREGATAAEGMSFIMSRPWFIHVVEANEELIRCYSKKDETALEVYGASTASKVEKRWKERGLVNNLRGWWRWPHESPSLEPKELFTLEDVEDVELTPSEADALEDVPRPSSPPLPYLEYTIYGPPRPDPDLSSESESNSSVSKEPTEHPPSSSGLEIEPRQPSTSGVSRRRLKIFSSDDEAPAMLKTLKSSRPAPSRHQPARKKRKR